MPQTFKKLVTKYIDEHPDQYKRVGGKVTRYSPELAELVRQEINKIPKALENEKTVTKLVAMWTVLTVMFVPTLGYVYGVNGAAAGYAIVSSSSVIAIYIARKHVKFSIIDGALKTFLASMLMGIVIFIIRAMLETSFNNMVIMIIIGGISYLMFSYLLFGSKLISDVKRITQIFVGKK